jgi:hypothetical protein
MNNVEFDIFEAVCGARGMLPAPPGMCREQAPPASIRPDAPQEFQYPMLGCSRQRGHAGDHVAAAADGRLLARWSTQA